MRRWLAAALLVSCAGAAAAQGPAYVRRAGPGVPGQILRSALAGPHLLLRPDTVVVLPRGQSYPSTVIIVGQDAKIAGEVHGSVIVVGGGLFLHPGARVYGSAVALGSGVYASSLARVDGETLAFRDLTFDVAETPRGLAFDYRDLTVTEVPRLAWPGIYGVRIPSYDRVNGLSLPFGPVFAFDTGRYVVNVLAIYRSDLGDVDPWIEIVGRPTRRLTAEIAGGRATFTNDGWIRSDLINSLTAIATGTDVRNYYRADRVQGFVRWQRDPAAFRLEPFAGALTERAWSVGPTPLAESAPWSLFNRDDRDEGLLRPNPSILPGRITSAVIGTTADWDRAGLVGELELTVESAIDAPEDLRFVQTTLSGELVFPTVRNHYISIESRVVTTGGDIAPPQRWSYLGGSGTLPTFDLLEFGGDELFFAEGRYVVPIERFTLPILGAPIVMLRYMTGSAGIGELPPLEQNLGIRLALALVKVDFVMEPTAGETEVSFGLSLSR